MLQLFRTSSMTSFCLAIYYGVSGCDWTGVYICFLLLNKKTAECSRVSEWDYSQNGNNKCGGNTALTCTNAYARLIARYCRTFFIKSCSWHCPTSHNMMVEQNVRRKRSCSQGFYFEIIRCCNKLQGLLSAGRLSRARTAYASTNHWTLVVRYAKYSIGE